MKIFSWVLCVLALVLIAINVTKVDTANAFEGESFTAVVGILAALCAIVLVLILNVSRKIQQKLRSN